MEGQAFRVLAMAMIVGIAGCGAARRVGFDFVAGPRRVPKPKVCSDYANTHEVLIDERAGKLTKSDERWLDMDGDGRFCEETWRAYADLALRYVA